MSFFEDGPKPKKNAEVMSEVLKELRSEGLYFETVEEAAKPVAEEATNMEAEEEKPAEIVTEKKPVAKKAVAKKKAPEPVPEEAEPMEAAEADQ